MARRKASSDSHPTKPKVHVTPTGGMYVEAHELLRTPEVRKVINQMAQIAEDANKRSSEQSSGGPETPET